MKTCTSCKAPKPLSEFNKQARSPDGFNTQCKKCISDYRKDKYNERKAQGLEPTTAQWQRDNKDKLNAIRAEKRREIRDYIRLGKVGIPCTDCGGTFPPTCMDWDHLDASAKEFNISGDSTRELYSYDKIDAEIKKCELVCSNCHRIRTAIRRGDPPLEYEIAAVEDSFGGMWGL